MEEKVIWIDSRRDDESEEENVNKYQLIRYTI